LRHNEVICVKIILEEVSSKCIFHFVKVVSINILKIQDKNIL